MTQKDAQINAPAEEKTPMKTKTRAIIYSNTPGVGYQRMKAPQMPNETKEALKTIRQAAGNTTIISTPLLSTPGYKGGEDSSQTGPATTTSQQTTHTSSDTSYDTNAPKGNAANADTRTTEGE